MGKKTPASPVSRDVAQWVKGRYFHLWGFVDSRIQKALIADSVLMELRIQPTTFLDGKSAKWLEETLQKWTDEATEILEKRHHMKVSE